MGPEAALFFVASATDVQCSCCCGTTNSDCELEWSWGAVLATLSVSAVFATCSGILALAEKRRKRKGLSLARAWSLPHGMPVLRATVVDLSDAVRGRASIWGIDGLSEHWSNDNDQALEHVGLLEEIPNDSGDADIPVAKLAEDNWVTAMAWREANASALYDNAAQNEESPTSPSTSWSRWASARATARQARRIVTATTAYSDSGMDHAVGGESGGAGSDGASGEEQEVASVGSLESAVVVRHSSSRSLESLR
eukprot:jgi/Undpi1/5823/HiC_scaffold_2.g01097.m1